MFAHPIDHIYQPTNYTCTHTATAMILPFFGRKITVERLIDEAPAIRDGEGKVCGMLTQYIGTWALKNGFDATLYVADFEVVDLSWAKLPREVLLERMRVVKDRRSVPSLGKDGARLYLESYIEFVENGGELIITPCISTKLLNELLPKSPLVICVAYSVLYGIGRMRSTGLRESSADDLAGELTAHSIVAYGRDSQGHYLIADPWRAPGLHSVEPDTLLAAIAAAQFTCEASVLQFFAKA
jgi:hypothetical protein